MKNNKSKNWSICTIGVARGDQGARNATNGNATNDKNVTKKLLFLQFQFLLASSYTHTTVIKNNIDPGGPGPLNLIFPTNFNEPPTIIFKWPSIEMGPQQ